MENAYVYSPQQILEHFGVSEQKGLSDVQVQIAQEKYGRNGR